MNAAITSQIGKTQIKDIPQDYSPEGKARWFVLPTGIDAEKKLFYYDHVFGEGEPMATVVFVHICCRHCPKLIPIYWINHLNK